MVEIDLSCTIKTPKSPCPNCGDKLDYATGPAGGPRSGDATICVRCQHICIYDEKLMLRHPTHDELLKMAGDERIVTLMNALAKVRR